MIASLFIMPATFYLVFKSTRVTETFRVIAIVFFLALPAYGWFMSLIGHPIEGKNVREYKAYQLEQERDNALKRFQANKDTIIKGIRHYYDLGNYRFAYAHADESMIPTSWSCMKNQNRS